MLRGVEGKPQSGRRPKTKDTLKHKTASPICKACDGDKRQTPFLLVEWLPHGMPGPGRSLDVV